MSARVLKCGLIGANIGRSRFPLALDIMCSDAGMRLEFELIDTVGEDGFDFAETVARLKDSGWHGVAVTHPYKSAAAALLDTDKTGLGAVNTLTFQHKDLCGVNTDYTGFLSAWASDMDGIAPGRVVIAGAGGVAHALVPALARLGASDIAIRDIDAARAHALAAMTGGPCRAVATEDSMVLSDADGLVNATACGMAGYPPTAFDLPHASRPKWAFDAVYTPTDTPFLIEAARCGARILSGFSLFQHMALNSFAALTGIVPDPATTLPKLAALKPKEEHTYV